MSGYYEIGIIDAEGRVKKGTRPMRLPRVTSILDALPKNGLQWWGMKIGVKGALALLGDDKLTEVLDGADGLDVQTEKVYEALKKEKVHTPSAVLGKAADRGTAVHEELCEKLFTTGKMPPKAEIPEEHHGYAEALWAWWKHAQETFPTIEVVAVEVSLFSLQYGYAGTTDLILKVTTEAGIVYVIVDFKTPKAIYESHKLQLPAYLHAAIENGYIPHDAMTLCLIVRLAADGTYEQLNTDYTVDDFLRVKQVWELLQEMNA